MKKFLKTKIQLNEPEQSASKQPAPKEPGPKQPTPKLDLPIVKSDKSIPEERPDIYPPLPPGPPPPLSLVVTKQEIVEECEEVISEGFLKLENIQNSEATNSEPEVCREYLRGNCTRLSTCKYLHIDDPSPDQLRKAFTFCHKFQNSQCNLPNCKFIHASTIEELRFYRTRVLPPNALAHIKPNNVTETAPPPVTIANEDFFLYPQTHDMNINEPSPTNSIQNPMPVMSIMPAASAEALSINCFNENTQTLMTPTHTIWNENNDFLMSPTQLDQKITEACEKCKIQINRLHHTQNEADLMIKKSAEHKKRMNEIEKANQRLFETIGHVFKQRMNSMGSDVNSDIMELVQTWDSRFEHRN